MSARGGTKANLWREIDRLRDENTRLHSENRKLRAQIIAAGLGVGEDADETAPSAAMKFIRDWNNQTGEGA